MPTYREALEVVQRTCPGIRDDAADIWARALTGEGARCWDERFWGGKRDGLQYGVWGEYRRIETPNGPAEALSGYYWLVGETLLGKATEQRSPLFLTEAEASVGLIDYINDHYPEESARLKQFSESVADMVL